jgi:hypothetical protein
VRFREQAPRALVGHPSPEVLHVLGWQARGQLAAQSLRRRVRFAAREAQHREQRHLARGPLVETARRAGKEALRRGGGLVELPVVVLFGRRQMPERAPRCAELAVLLQQAHPAPDIVDAEAPGFDHFLGYRIAALGQLARFLPDRARLIESARVGTREARQPGVAADLEVVLHQHRQLLLEVLPVGALAQHLQPVGAQPIGEIAARLLLEEGANVGIGGLLDAQLDAPVLRVRRQTWPVSWLENRCNFTASPALKAS